MSGSSNNASGGVGFAGLLGLLFIGLKPGHVIDWEWKYALLPFYGPLLLATVVFLFLLTVGASVGLLKKHGL